MKNFFKVSILTLLLILGLIACQKQEISLDEKNKDEYKLTEQDLELKEKMEQAALIIVKFSNNKEIQEEIQNLIDLKMYKDDYIPFKDLFQPQNNNKLKSISTTKFAQKFRSSVPENKFKSKKDFNLETFLIENNLNLYVPYPLENYPENMRTPTITFHPLDNDSVNIGYKLTTNKSTTEIQQVNKVNEKYSEEVPIYIISPSMYQNPNDGGSGTGSGTGTGTGTGTETETGTHTLVKLVHMRLKD